MRTTKLVAIVSIAIGALVTTGAVASSKSVEGNHYLSQKAAEAHAKRWSDEPEKGHIKRSGKVSQPYLNEKNQVKSSAPGSRKLDEKVIDVPDHWHRSK